MRENAKDALIVALDVPSVEEARRLIDKVSPRATFFKIGMEILFQTGGMAFAQELTKSDKKLFLDVKAFDIPRTVIAALGALDDIGATFVSVHSLSRSLLQHLAKRKCRTKVVGITLLTSMGDDDLRALGIEQSLDETVLALASLAIEIGNLDGLVASGREVGMLRKKYPDTILITPGIRPIGTDVQDQRRTTTPYEAIVAGADHIVVGRAITQAEEPLAIVEQIFEEIEQGLQERDGVADRVA